MNSSDDDVVVGLRQRMVAELRGMGGIRSEAVAQAFQTVPRHLFAPDVPVEMAYAANTSVWPKRDTETGVLTSVMSAAHIQAVQLEQAAIEPDMNVLEIGSGGCNAAMLATIVGDDSAVTSVDIDAEIVARARRCLDAAGYARVRTVLADGDAATPAHGPYDRILVTCRAWDIPLSWIAQLVPSGRIVVPLQLRGLTRTVALDRSDEPGVWLTGGDPQLCSFVPMQGEGAHADRIATVQIPDGDGRAQLRTDSVEEHELAEIVHGVAQAMQHDPISVWTGVEFDHVDDLDLWLGLHLDRFAVMTADREITDTGRPTAITRAGAPAAVSSRGFAYRTKRPIPGTDGFETGVLAWGPDAADLAERYVEEVRGWGRYRWSGGRGPSLRVHAAGAPVIADPATRIVDKIHTRIAASWNVP